MTHFNLIAVRNGTGGLVTEFRVEAANKTVDGWQDTMNCLGTVTQAGYGEGKYWVARVDGRELARNADLYEAARQVDLYHRGKAVGAAIAQRIKEVSRG